MEYDFNGLLYTFCLLYNVGLFFMDIFGDDGVNCLIYLWFWLFWLNLSQSYKV